MAFKCVICVLVVIGCLVTPLECQISEGCPTNDFIAWDGSNFCYTFQANTLDWFSANADCANQYKDATLASITTQDENDFIYSSMQTNTAQFYWIGLYKAISGDQVGQLTWIDGSPYPNPNQWDNFEDGQPDNVTGSGNDCVSLNEASQGQWSDEACTAQKGYVCKTKKLSLQTGSCPEDWTLSGTTCYYANTDGATSFTAAIQECQTLGGPSALLATIRSAAENTVVYNLMSGVPDANKNIWIGLERCGDPEDLDNAWFWYDETPVSTDWDNWDEGQPDGDGDCAAANLEGGFSRWEEIDCGTLIGVFCKAPKNGAPCQPPFVENPDDDSFCYYVNPTLGLTQPNAAQWCIDHGLGATLGSLQDATEANFVNILAQGSGSNVHSYWIGLYRYLDDAPWSWQDNSDKAIVKWNDGEPTNDVATDLCASTGLLTATWFSTDCGQAYPYACKAVPGNPAEDCANNGFELFESACYLFVGDQALTQGSAYQACKQAWQLASLVSLVTTDEHNFVYQRMVNATTLPGATDYWIGYTRCDPGDQIFSWVWLDNGQKINEDDYYNFVLPVGEENCAYMNQNSNWTDYSCNLGRGYACEVAAINPTTSSSAPTTTTTTSGGGGDTTTSTVPPTTTTRPSEDISDGGGLSSGDIVGIVFGVIIGLALIAAGGIVGYIYWLKPRMAAGGSSSTGKDTTAFAFSNTTYSDGQDDV